MSKSGMLTRDLGGEWEYDQSTGQFVSNDGRAVVKEDDHYVLLDKGKKIAEIDGLDEDLNALVVIRD